MPDRSSKGKPTGPKPDPNEIAARIVDEATDDEREPLTEPEQPDDGKDPAAVSLGRRGGLKGGKARAEKLTPERRKEIAQKAAKARWSGTDNATGTNEA